MLKAKFGQGQQMAVSQPARLVKPTLASNKAGFYNMGNKKMVKVFA